MSLGKYQDLINTDDSIIGISTNIDKVSALAIVRISGPIGPADLSRVISIDPNKIKPRYQHFCKLLQEGNVLDEVLLTFFKGPHSFTGENCFELSLHGNPLSVKRIVGYLSESLGLRLAEPGEFTLRALKNKKLSLSQVEGLDNFLHAQSITALNSSLTLLNGEIHKNFIKLQDSFMKLKMSIDLNTDFAEDMGEEESEKMFKDALSNFLGIIQKLNNKVVRDPEILKTPTVCLVGAVNAGKSTLFNSVLKENRSIVSDEKGTTRDYVTEQVFSNDFYYKLIDTAGIRETKNKVEAEGIKRSIEILENSFYKILVVSCSDLETVDSFKYLEFDLVVFTHADSLKNNSSIYSLKTKKYVILDQIKGSGVGPIGPDGNLIKSGSMGPQKYNETGPIGPVTLDVDLRSPQSGDRGPIEPLKNRGPIEPLEFSRDKLLELYKNGPIEPLQVADIISSDISWIAQQDVIFVSRQVEAIKSIYRNSSEINDLASKAIDVGLIGQLISNLDADISSLIGVYTPDDVLNNIFSNFCIGK